MNEASSGHSPRGFMGGLGVELIFYALAVAVGIGAAQMDFKLMVPMVMAMVGFMLMRFVLSRPFHEAFAFYIAIAAFNFYYFYCSALTGRNPTDVGEWGTPATTLEKLQKDIIFFFLLGLAAIKLFKNRMEGLPFLYKDPSHPLLKLIAVFVLYSVLRGTFWLLQGDQTYDALYYLRSNIEFALIPFLMCTFLLNREKSLRIIFKAIIYALPIVAILGIIEFLIHGSPFQRNFYGGQIFSRATSTLQNPNNLGGYLVTAIGVYILYFFKNQLTRFERLLFWPTMPLAFICLFMTISRSSLIMFFISMTITFSLLYYNTLRQQGKQRINVCRNLMISYVVTLLASYFVLNKYFDLRNSLANAVELYVHSSDVSNSRLYAPLIALNEITSNPLVALFGFNREFSHSDNVFANIMLTSGLIGFFIYVSIWGRALWICVQRVLDAKKSRSFLYLICFYVLCFQVLYGFTAVINQNFPHNMYFWFTIGVVVWLESKPMREPKPSEIEDLTAEDSPNKALPSI